MQKLLNEASPDTHKDLMMLKLILTSGLYPQIAVEDEHNSSKTVSEKLYHTKTKNYVFLRPTSYFAANPEILELGNDDVEVPPPGYFSRRPISRRHQVLVYQSILETRKVYLVNAMRMPALQTLVMFGKTVATNATMTKFVVDDFLLFDVPYFGQGERTFFRVLLGGVFGCGMDFYRCNYQSKPRNSSLLSFFRQDAADAGGVPA